MPKYQQSYLDALGLQGEQRKAVQAEMQAHNQRVWEQGAVARQHSIKLGAMVAPGEAAYKELAAGTEPEQGAVPPLP